MDPGNGSFALWQSPHSTFETGGLSRIHQREAAKRAEKKSDKSKTSAQPQANIAPQPVQVFTGSRHQTAVTLFQPGDNNIITPGQAAETETRVLYVVATQTRSGDNNNAYVLRVDSCWQSLEQAKQRIAEIAQERQARSKGREVMELHTEFLGIASMSDSRASNPPSIQLTPHVTSHELDSVPVRDAGDSMGIQRAPDANLPPTILTYSPTVPDEDGAVSVTSRSERDSAVRFHASVTPLKSTSAIKTRVRLGDILSTRSNRKDEIWVVAKYNVDTQDINEVATMWVMDAILPTAKLAMEHAERVWKSSSQNADHEFRPCQDRKHAAWSLRPANISATDKKWSACPQIKIESVTVKALPPDSILVTSETVVTVEEYPSSVDRDTNREGDSTIPTISVVAPFTAVPAPAFETHKQVNDPNNLSARTSASRRSISMKHRPLSSISTALSAAEARRSVTESAALSLQMLAPPSITQEEREIRDEMAHLENRLRHIRLQRTEENQLRAPSQLQGPAELEAEPVPQPISEDAQASENGSLIRGDDLDEIYEIASEEDGEEDDGARAPRTRPATPLDLDRLLEQFPRAPTSDLRDEMEEEAPSGTALAE